MRCSEDVGIFSLVFFLGDLFEILVNNRDCKHDTCAGADSTEHISEDTKSTDTDSTEGSGRSDITRKVTNHGFLSETTLNSHILVHQLSADVLGRLA